PADRAAARTSDTALVDARPPRPLEPTTPVPRPDHPDRTELDRLVDWFDARTGMLQYSRTILSKVFPDHWTFLLGEVALFSFIILVATGTFLTFFYVPDSRPVTYTGPYGPLDGAQVSAAYDSVLKISLVTRAGLLFRQIHHWAALLFLGSISVHLARVFFTGAFRKPRDINWLIGSGLLLFALAEGITGYSLPDDLLSGTGLRIMYSAALSIPFVGPWVASLIFSGEFPTVEFISRLFVIHVMLLPGLLIGGIGAHVGLVFLQKHTQYKLGRRREDNVVGLPFWPGQVFRSTGLFFLVAATITLIGGLIQINPVWLYGPFLPYAASTPAQPDWYVGWLEGLLRLAPSFEPVIAGIRIPAPFVPGVVVPGALVTGLVLWPFIERRITGDDREHNLLDWPWDTPMRTATGAAAISLFVVVTLAGANDVIGIFLDIPIETLTGVLRVLVVAVPVVAWLLTYRLASHRRDRGAPSGGRPRGIRLRRTASGGFEEVEGA
ncbi:MAG TPA: ubiquinol-cytochrome c reductase cytochrome b subunit, partial [Candidatus Limnocylindrales bacterium]